jgi:hypothetical protein
LSHHGKSASFKETPMGQLRSRAGHASRPPRPACMGLRVPQRKGLRPGPGSGQGPARIRAFSGARRASGREVEVAAGRVAVSQPMRRHGQQEEVEAVGPAAARGQTPLQGRDSLGVAAGAILSNAQRVEGVSGWPRRAPDGGRRPRRGNPSGVARCTARPALRGPGAVFEAREMGLTVVTNRRTRPRISWWPLVPNGGRCAV